MMKKQNGIKITYLLKSKSIMFLRLHTQSATNIFSLSHSKTGQCRDKICHKLPNALKCIYMYAHKNCLLCLF